MARGWYGSIGNSTTGPFSTEQIIEDVKNNKITAEATVCAAGLTRFHKITEEAELAAAFAPAVALTKAPATTTPAAAPGTALPMCGTATQCCPMPRIVAATTLVLSAAFWSTAAVAATHATATMPARLSSSAGISASVAIALVALVFLSGIVRRKGCAHCGATALHIAGLIGAVSFGLHASPVFFAVAGVHALGLLSTCGARRQICRAKAPTTAV